MGIYRAQNGSLILIQTKYIKKFKRHGMEQFISTNVFLILNQLIKPPKKLKNKPKKLMHFMMRIRLDIVQAVSRCAQYINNPTNKHLIALKRIFRCLQNFQTLGICYSKTIDFLYLEIWTAKNWGKSIDDSKFVNDYLVIMIKDPMAWKFAKKKRQ